MRSSKATPRRPQAADATDVLWCYANLDHPTVTRADAPSPGAWNLLLWAREARSRFFTTVLPRAFPQPSDEHEGDDGSAEGGGAPMTLREYILWGWKREDERRISDVSPDIAADAERLVGNWNRLTGNKLNDEARTGLSSHVAFAVQLALKAAAQWPEKFAECLEDAEGWDDDVLPQMADAIERFRGDPSLSQVFTTKARGLEKGLQASR